MDTCGEDYYYLQELKPRWQRNKKTLTFGSPLHNNNNLQFVLGWCFTPMMMLVFINKETLRLE